MLDSVTPAPSWTYESEIELERLWKEGKLSGAKIGRQLGGFSRSAVLGKVHRMGLSLRVAGKVRTERKPDKRRHPPEYYVELRQQRQALREKACKMKADGYPLHVIARHLNRSGTWVCQNTASVEVQVERKRAFTPKAPADTLAQVFEFSDGPNRVTLNDMVNGQCRWPYGDPLGDNFRFCGDGCLVTADRHGRAFTSSYCEHHHIIAYQAAS